MAKHMACQKCRSRNPADALFCNKCGYKLLPGVHSAEPKSLTGFVDREDSMAVLGDTFRKVQSGSGQIVGIVGEAGVGKSRIIHELHNRLPRNEYIWHEGRCLHYGGFIPYLPIIDLLKSYFKILSGEREDYFREKIQDTLNDLDERLISVIAPFQEILSLKVEDEEFSKLNPRQKSENTFEALRLFFTRVSQDVPFVIAIEDMHWADKTTEEFVDYLIDWVPHTRILLILIFRPKYAHQWKTKSNYTEVCLERLDTVSSTQLIQGILGAEVVPELKEFILNTTTGNPLFIEEFTQFLLENGFIHRDANRYVLNGGAEKILVPDTFQGLISAQLEQLEDTLKRTMQKASIIGRSKGIQKVMEAVIQAAEHPVNVFIRGETGTGKALVARAIHNQGKRQGQLFFEVNCAEFAPGVLESELFGHEKGAFTGAVSLKKGIFEIADSGTLFLDEIAEIPLPMQPKLLRVIETKNFKRVGGEWTRASDFRLITATNRDIEQEVAAGNFREDLFYRLNIFNIDIPPLRHRKEDIPLIAEYYFQLFVQKYQKPIQGLTENALLELRNYEWPGNVRELINILERAVITCKESVITTNDLPFEARPQERISDLNLKEMEAFYIDLALKRTGGNKTKASQILGISRKTLIEKLKRNSIWTPLQEISNA